MVFFHRINFEVNFDRVTLTNVEVFKCISLRVHSKEEAVDSRQEVQGFKIYRTNALHTCMLIKYNITHISDELQLW